MKGLYGYMHLTGVDGTVYWVKEADDDYFLKNSVGGIFYIVYDKETITVKKGRVRDFQGK